MTRHWGRGDRRSEKWGAGGGLEADEGEFLRHSHQHSGEHSPTQVPTNGRPRLFLPQRSETATLPDNNPDPTRDVLPLLQGENRGAGDGESHRQGRGDQIWGSGACREVQLRASQLEGRRPQTPAGRSTGARPDSQRVRSPGLQTPGGSGRLPHRGQPGGAEQPTPRAPQPRPCAARAAPPGLAARRAHLGSAPPRRRQREGAQAAMRSGGSRLRGPDPAAPPRSAPPRRRRSGCEGRGALRPFRSGSLLLRCCCRRRRRGARPDGSSDQPIRARRALAGGANRDREAGRGWAVRAWL